jgi:hypothetical protein
MDEMPLSSSAVDSSFPSSSSSSSSLNMPSDAANSEALISAIADLLTGNAHQSLLATTTTSTLASTIVGSNQMGGASAVEEQPMLDTWRVPPSLFAVFVLFYAAVFFCGLVGNIFVVAAIAMNKSLRTATDWLISSLAVSFSLPPFYSILNSILDLSVGRSADSDLLPAQHFAEQFAHRSVCLFVILWRIQEAASPLLGLMAGLRIHPISEAHSQI